MATIEGISCSLQHFMFFKVLDIICLLLKFLHGFNLKRQGLLFVGGILLRTIAEFKKNFQKE